MRPASRPGVTAAGGCLCGAVRFEIIGTLRNVVNCHCSKCRRFHGSFGAYTRVDQDALVLVERRGLKWFRSSTDETPNVQRGFCMECGSSLFWHPTDQGSISVAAGSLDSPTGLETMGHIWLSQKGDFYDIRDDFPKFERGWSR